MRGHSRRAAAARALQEEFRSRICAMFFANYGNLINKNTSPQAKLAPGSPRINRRAEDKLLSRFWAACAGSSVFVMKRGSLSIDGKGKKKLGKSRNEKYGIKKYLFALLRRIGTAQGSVFYRSAAFKHGKEFGVLCPSCAGVAIIYKTSRGAVFELYVEGHFGSADVYE